jgi:hypothetical protein
MTDTYFRAADALIVSLLKRAIPAKTFADAAKIRQEYISLIKAGKHNKVPENVRDFITEVYKKCAFDKVLTGEFTYENLKSRKPHPYKKKTEPSEKAAMEYPGKERAVIIDITPDSQPTFATETQPEQKPSKEPSLVLLDMDKLTIGDYIKLMQKEGKKVMVTVQVEV